MRVKFHVIAILAVLFSASANAQEIGLDFLSPEIGFLKPNQAYHIRFATGRHPFLHTESGFTQATSRTEDGTVTNSEPRKYTTRLSLGLFRVLKHGGGPWILVEHPSSSNDYGKWYGKHRAEYMLRQPDSESLDEGQTVDAKEAANQNISLTQTWLNTDHAITIRPVTAESLGVATAER